MYVHTYYCILYSTVHYDSRAKVPVSILRRILTARRAVQNSADRNLGTVKIPILSAKARNSGYPARNRTEFGYVSNHFQRAMFSDHR
jgi:hypothetical protein